MYKLNNYIDGAVVIVLQAIVVDRGFEPQSDQAKDYWIDIYCKDWLTQKSELCV